MRRIDGVAHEPLQAIPGSQDLRQVLFSQHAAMTIERDTFLDFDAEVAGTGTALFQRFEELRMGSDAGAAADELDG